MKLFNANPTTIFEVIRQTVASSRNRLSVKTLCELTGVSRAGYYNYVKTMEERKARDDSKEATDLALILKAMRKYPNGCGTRPIKMELGRQGVVMSRARIDFIMDKYEIKCMFRQRNPRKQFMKDVLSGAIVANLVNRKFRDYGPRIILLTDVTYLPHIGKDGVKVFAYLSAILDAYTDEILAYVVSDNMKEDFVLETIDQLVDKYGIQLTEWTIIHSDQGIQYTNQQFGTLLKDYNLRQSMSRKGNCLDNAPMESFWGHMKDEIGGKIYNCTTIEGIRKIVDEYIYFHNYKRPQWNRMRMTPNEYFIFCTEKILPEWMENVHKELEPVKDPSTIGVMQSSENGGAASKESSGKTAAPGAAEGQAAIPVGDTSSCENASQCSASDDPSPQENPPAN